MIRFPCLVFIHFRSINLEKEVNLNKLKLQLVTFLATLLICLSSHATTQVINGGASIQDLKSLTPVALNYETMDVSDPDITFDGVSRLTVAQDGQYRVRYAVSWGVDNKKNVKSKLIY